MIYHFSGPSASALIQDQRYRYLSHGDDMLLRSAILSMVKTKQTIIELVIEYRMAGLTEVNASVFVVRTCHCTPQVNFSVAIAY